MAVSFEDAVPLSRLPGLVLVSDTPKGRGVFTMVPIPRGTHIDTNPVLVLSPTDNEAHIKHTVLYHYTYNWPAPTSDAASAPSQPLQAVVLGLGSLFNHSSRDQNVVWTRDVARGTVTYRAARDIATGEELCISYGARLTFVDADAISEEPEEAENVLRSIQVDELTR
ncbi:protein methyltransferase [Trichodelitschia bisporula]|uniref:Protein methyltransferase n=1 Tax=Trichodelitschia bisporula TaxID=703511 RepID=A0A6G1HT08_9PEZI|nr:protein methyltransferase [Trichodelitschia bisporula]